MFRQTGQRCFFRKKPILNRYVCGQQPQQLQQRQYQCAKQQFVMIQRAIKNNSLTTNNNIGFRTATLSTVAPVSEEIQTVFDILITLVFVDPSGARRKVSGMIGQTIYEVATMHGIDLGSASIGGKEYIKRTENWTERTFGEGTTSGYCMVIIAGKGTETATPESYWEGQLMDDYWEYDELYEGSRLATCVTLTKEMDGMTVFVPDRQDDEVP